jgi:PKD repeat protein
MAEAKTVSRQGWTVNIQQVPTLHEDEVHVFMASVPGASDMTITDLTFTWAFGDQYSNASDPDKVVALGNITATHTYTRLGTYSVGLTVRDSSGNVSSASVNVLVENVVPTPDMTIMRRSTFEDEPITVMATGNLDTPSDIPNLVFSWAFDIEPFSAYSSKTSVERTYPQAGTHTVSLKVKDEHGAEGVVTRPFSVDDQPPLAIAGKDVIAYQDRPVQFDGRKSIDTPSDIATLKFSWDFVDGTSANGPMVSHQFKKKGQSIVWLTVTDDDGASTSDQVRVTVLNSPPIAKVSILQIGGSDFVVLDGTDSTDSENDLPFLTYQWWFGDGVSGTGKTVTHRFGNTGTFSGELTVMDPEGTSSVASFDITVTARAPTAVIGPLDNIWVDQMTYIVANDIKSPDGGPVDAYWTLDGKNSEGSWSRLTNNQFVYNFFSNDTEQHALRLYLRNGQGSVAFYDLQVRAKDPAPVANFKTDWLVLSDHSVTLDASSSRDNPSDMATLVYRWSFGDGTTANGMIVDHTYTRPGDYTVNLTVTDRFGVPNTIQRIITVLSEDLLTKFGGKVLTVEYSVVDTIDGKEGINPGEYIMVTGLVSPVQGWTGPDFLRQHTAVVTIHYWGLKQDYVQSTRTEPGGTFGIFVTAPTNAGKYTLEVTATIGFLTAQGASELEVKKEQTAASPVSMPIVAGVTTATAGLIAIGAVGGTDLGRYKFFTLLIPLFTRLRKARILDHFERGRIYEHIRKTPGDSYSSIRKTLGIKNGALAHHLRVLEVHEYIVSRRDGMYKRFYPKGMRIPEGKHKSIQEQLLEMIMGNPKITQKEMAERLGIDRSTVNYHIKILMAMGVIRSEKDGTVKFYYFVGIREPFPYEG